MTKQKLISWTVVLLWMAVIFYLSSQAAVDSEQLSTGISEMIKETLNKVFGGSDLLFSNFGYWIRKSAHFISYLVLGLLVFSALHKSGIQRARGALIALLICFLYACSDEIHQLFVVGRSGELKDVMIDTAGAFVGISIMIVAHHINKKKNTTSNVNHFDTLRKNK